MEVKCLRPKYYCLTQSLSEFQKGQLPASQLTLSFTNPIGDINDTISAVSDALSYVTVASKAEVVNEAEIRLENDAALARNISELNVQTAQLKVKAHETSVYKAMHYPLWQATLLSMGSSQSATNASMGCRRLHNIYSAVPRPL